MTAKQAEQCVLRIQIGIYGILVALCVRQSTDAYGLYVRFHMIHVRPIPSCSK
jgi:hypothetical protein